MHRPFTAIGLIALLVSTLPATARGAAPAVNGGHGRWQSGNSLVALTGSTLPWPRGMSATAPLASSQRLTVSIVLGIRDSDGLARLIHDLYDRNSPRFHHFLTREQFVQRYALPHSTRGRVLSWLHARGLRVGQVAPNGLLMTVTGDVRRLQSAFGTRLVRYSRHGRSLFANVTAVHLPRMLTSSIRAIVGLSNRPVAPLRPQGRVLSGGIPNGFTPSQLSHLYDLDPLHATGIDGGGQSIGIVALADYDQANVDTYDRAFGLADAVTRVPVSDGTHTGAPLGDGQGETETDIEVAQGVAPAAHVLVYESSNSEAGMTAILNRVVSDDTARVVASSWGGWELSYSPDTIRALDQIFREAAAQGQAFFAASGDAGAFDRSSGPQAGAPLGVDFPASDPWVTGVGGTSLEAGTTGYGAETAWSDTSNPQAPIGSGGGLSKLFARPTYQSGPGVTNMYSNGMREVPDVAADAAVVPGYAIFTANPHLGHASWTQVGGTSAATPLWAGFATLVNQAVGHPVGFMNPTLYQLGQLAPSESLPPFHDVVHGYNLYFPATTGWDFATGWGSFDGAAFVADLKDLPAPAPEPVAAAVPAPTVTPTATMTPQPTVIPTPAPTMTALPPRVSIAAIVLLHRTGRGLHRTRTLEVGERGTLIVRYSSDRPPSESPWVLVLRGASTIRRLVLRPATYHGESVLSAHVRIAAPRWIGTLSARVTISVAAISAVRTYSFRLAAK